MNYEKCWQVRSAEKDADMRYSYFVSRLTTRDSLLTTETNFRILTIY